jgi:hypothetical protein
VVPTRAGARELSSPLVALKACSFVVGEHTVVINVLRLRIWLLRDQISVSLCASFPATARSRIENRCGNGE